MLDVTQWGRLLLYSTQRGGVHALDHRAGGDAWVLPAKARQVRTSFLRRSEPWPAPSLGLVKPPARPSTPRS